MCVCAKASGGCLPRHPCAATAPAAAAAGTRQPHVCRRPCTAHACAWPRLWYGNGRRERVLYSWSRSQPCGRPCWLCFVENIFHQIQIRWVTSFVPGPVPEHACMHDRAAGSTVQACRCSSWERENKISISIYIVVDVLPDYMDASFDRSVKVCMPRPTTCQQAAPQQGMAAPAVDRHKHVASQRPRAIGHSTLV